MVAAAISLLTGRRMDVELEIPRDPRGLIVFALADGLRDPRHRAAAKSAGATGFATLWVDLFTEDEMTSDLFNGSLDFEIEARADRLVEVIDWARDRPELAFLPFACFAARTTAAIALIAAARRPSDIGALALVSPRADLAQGYLRFVKAPSLLIAGQNDPTLPFCWAAEERLRGPTEVMTVPGGSYAFLSDGSSDRWFARAIEWIDRYLTRKDRDVPKRPERVLSGQP